MKRVLIIAGLLLLFVFPCHVSAAQTAGFDHEIEQLEEQAGDDPSALRIDSVDDVINNGIDSMAIMDYLGELLQKFCNTPYLNFIRYFSKESNLDLSEPPETEWRVP